MRGKETFLFQMEGRESRECLRLARQENPHSPIILRNSEKQENPELTIRFPFSVNVRWIRRLL